MRPERSPRSGPPPAGVEALALALSGLALAVGVVVWTGGVLAAAIGGGSVHAGVVDALPVALQLAADPGAPATAWGDKASGLPGPLIYWVCTVVATAAVGGLVAGLWRVWQRLSSTERRRFGSVADARAAARRDIDVLAVDSTQTPRGRLLLGTWHPEAHCSLPRTVSGTGSAVEPAGGRATAGR